MRRNIQIRLSKSKDENEYRSLCKKILEEIASNQDSKKFLDIYNDEKTVFYDFTPSLIKKVQREISTSRENSFLTLQEIGKGTTETYRDNMPKSQDAIDTLEEVVRGRIDEKLQGEK